MNEVLLATPAAWESEDWYARAWALVLKRHGGRTDRLNRPAEEHFTRVARLLIGMFPQANRSQAEAALLHDALEPGGFSVAALQESGLTPGAIRIIERITLPTDGRSYLQYSEDLSRTGDTEAIQVKLADNADAFDLFTAIGGEEGERRIREQYIPSRDAMRRGLPG